MLLWGAKIVEKHFTLNREMEGPDHKASLEPDELKTMISSIRKVERALGTSKKQVSISERKNRDIARKSIFTAQTILKGEVFTEEKLTTKRPGNGINPMHWNEIIGKRANRDYKSDEMIEL